MATERPAYQQRVLEESADLAARLNRLRAYAQAPAFDTLDAAEQERLSRQEGIMTQYLGVLSERIAAFPA